MAKHDRVKVAKRVFNEEYAKIWRKRTCTRKLSDGTVCGNRTSRLYCAACGSKVER